MLAQASASSPESGLNAVSSFPMASQPYPMASSNLTPILDCSRAFSAIDEIALFAFLDPLRL
jgi:hypothetical protein